MALKINDTDPVRVYAAAAGQTVFSVPFGFFADTDLVVTRNGVVLVLATSPADAGEYAVSGAGVDGGGEITLGGGATAGDIVAVSRYIPIERTANYPLTGPFPIESLNIEQAKQIAMMQQLREELQRAIRVAIGGSGVEIDTTGISNGDIIIWDEGSQTFIVSSISPTGEIRGIARPHVGDTPPDNPVSGDQWWKSDEGRLKIYYDDGDSSQWVDSSPFPALGAGITDLCPVFNFTAAGEARFYAHEDMTLEEQDISGTGTITYQASTAAAPATFAAATSPITLEGGSWLIVEADAVTDIVAVALLRTQ